MVASFTQVKMVASTGPSRQEIIDYMRENARAWHKQASRPYKFQHIQAEELLFVSGTVKTPRYTAGFFRGDRHLTIRDALVGFTSADLPWGAYRHLTRAAKSPVQCVFIHYYKMKMRPRWWHQLERVVWWPSKSTRNWWIKSRQVSVQCSLNFLSVEA